MYSYRLKIQIKTTCDTDSWKDRWEDYRDIDGSILTFRDSTIAEDFCRSLKRQKLYDDVRCAWHTITY